MLSPSIVIARAVLACSGALPQDGAGLSLRLDEARDATGEGLAFVEASATKEAWLVEEPIRLTLRFGIEAEFLATKTVQPFGRALDVPVQVSAPWALEFPGPVDGAPASFALNEKVEHARRVDDRVVGTKTFRVYEIPALLAAPAASAAGELVLPCPLLAFAYATRFEEDLVRGRAAVDRVDAFVRGEPLRLAILPWPAEGRPEEFTGAVGTFTARAEVEGREIAMGESLKLALTIEGEGNLARFEAPRLERVGAFRVLGTGAEPGPSARRIVYDLAPETAQAWQIPPIPFAFLDPGPPPSYRVVRTEPIGIVVRPASAGTPDRRDPDPPVDAPATPRGAGRAWLAWGSGAIVLALALWILAARRPARDGS